MGKEKFELSHREGSLLFNYAHIQLPENLGDKKFDVTQRATATDQQVILRAALRAVSPVIRRDFRNCFGIEEAWEKVNGVQPDGSKAPESWTLKKDWFGKSVPVEFDEDAIYGAFWSLLQALHPSSQSRASVSDFDEVIWPMAKKLGLEVDLRRELQIEKRRGITLSRFAEKTEEKKT